MQIRYVCLVSILFQTSSAPFWKSLKSLFSSDKDSSRGGRRIELVGIPQVILLQRALLLTDMCTIVFRDLRIDAIHDLDLNFQLDAPLDASFSVETYLKNGEYSMNLINPVNCFYIIPQLNELFEIRLFSLQFSREFKAATGDAAKKQIVQEFIDSLDQISQLYLLLDVEILKTFYNTFKLAGIDHPLQNLREGLIGILLDQFATTDYSTHGTDIYTSPEDKSSRSVYPQFDYERKTQQLWPKLKSSKKVRNLVLWIVEKLDFEDKLEELRKLLKHPREEQVLEAVGEGKEVDPQSIEESPLLGVREAEAFMA